MPSPALFEYNGQRKWDEFTVFVPAVPLSQAKLQIHSVLFSIRSQARPEGRAHDSRFTLRFLVLTFPSTLLPLRRYTVYNNSEQIIGNYL